MEEKDIVMTEVAEETTQQPAWEVVPDPVDMETVEERLEDVEEALEEMEEDIKTGISAAKDWLSNILYEAGRVYQDHKKAVLAIAAAVAAVAAMAGALWVLLKKQK